MILEGIFDYMFGVLAFIMSWFPFFDITVDLDSINVFFDIIRSISYLLPMGTIFTLFNITMAVMGFRIMVSVVKTIWAVIPLL